MKKSLSTILGILVAALAIVALLVYRGAPRAISLVTTLLIAAAAVRLIDFVAADKLPDAIRGLLAIVGCALVAFALVTSFSTQIDQIGYVVAGLDPVSILQTFIIAAVLMAVALVLSIASCFVE